MTNFIWILFAHYVGDVALQTSEMAKFKKINWYGMLNHTMVWAACISIALQYLGLFQLWKVAFLIIGHWICDTWKSKKNRTPNAVKYLYIDQAIHIAQCFVVYAVN